jgi:Amt family ammonium transporter
MFGKLRISAEDEQAGLDVSKHGGSAYNHDQTFGKGAGHAAEQIKLPIV